MASLPLLVATIGALIVLNGLFSCMEIALVSVPRARLKRFQKEKLPGATTALALQKDIDRFFATVQTGVTFVATLTSAIGGASAQDLFSPVLEGVGISPESTAGQVIAILAVSVTISYVTLVIGELVPKSLARRYPGRISLKFARPFKVFASWMLPVVFLLTASTRGVLRVLGIKDVHAPSLTAEELRLMASELVENRQMPTRIYDMLVRVTRFSQIRVEDVMIPRNRIVAVHLDSRQDPQIKEKILSVYKRHPFTYFPVVDRSWENVLGLVNVKDLLLHDEPAPVSEMLRPAFFAVRGQTLDHILAAMQKNDEQMWVVVDEHGTVDGIITLEDVLEELTGDIESGIPARLEIGAYAEKRGGFVVDGLVTLHELKEHHSISLPQSLYYSTLAGFILDKMGKIPSPGDRFDYDHWRFEVVQMVRNRIKEVRVIPLKTATEGYKEV
ncbi:MAG: HlyC/CorC family transporter [Desulfomonile tiedjei]|uniref:HlyC/CorC family transporter n=1 Tax=Desulfomonile tiedjei TaxID=2358 RepID=A0A9D6V1P8_9BACT|nr:HlyC/CorC family transporter [Desulfomonile tiedjei]